jgi:hypothetical protein
MHIENPLPHTFYQERFDNFFFDAFRFTTGRSLDSYAHSEAFSDAHLHRIFCCDSIDTLNLSIVSCKLFNLEHFDAFRCVSVFFAALLAALSAQSSLSTFALPLEPALEASAPYCSPIRLRLLEVYPLPALLLTVAATLCFRAPACRHSA